MQIKVFKCEWCGAHLLEPGSERQPRSDKKFCSKVCRGKYRTWLKRLTVRQERAVKAIEEIAEYLQHPAAQPRAVSALVTIREMIDREAAYNGLKVVE